MSNRSKAAECAAAAPAGRGSIGRVVRFMLESFATWRERAEQRAHLHCMNERQLKDIGISRADAAREANKPFWRA